MLDYWCLRAVKYDNKNSFTLLKLCHEQSKLKTHQSLNVKTGRTGQGTRLQSQLPHNSVTMINENSEYKIKRNVGIQLTETPILPHSTSVSILAYIQHRKG